MFRRRLKPIRVAVALILFAGLTTAFVDFRGLMPVAVGRWLASVQFTPSLVAWATGAAGTLAWLVIVAATLVAGRVYCAAVCPLGILQDVLARLIGLFRVRRPLRHLPYARPQNWLRWLVVALTIAGVAAGWAGFTLSLLDPYSNFGRIAADLFRPLVTFANNAVAALADAIGVGTLYRVQPQWAGAGAAHQPMVLLVLLVVLVTLRGRLYCNTLCPLGTVLGWLARRAAFRLTIDPSACGKCAECLPACKAQCIDLKTRAVDASRCVACFNCLAACEPGAIRHRFAWRKSPRPAAGPSATRAAPIRGSDPQRRAFLTEGAAAVAAAFGVTRLLARETSDPAASAGTSGNTRPDTEPSPAICPPGAQSVDRFLARCTACHLCLSVCPTQVLEPAFLEYGFTGMMRPRLDFTRGACTFTCRACTEVCPDGALDRLELAEKQVTRVGEARLDLERCIVKAKGTDCAACSEQCPTQAVTTVPYGDNLRLPQLNLDLCTGCGGCEFACPVLPKKAITVTGLRRHGRAQRAPELKAPAPVNRDFPF